MGRVSTRPALRRKYSSSAYSRAVSVMRRRPRVTSRVAGSRTRSSEPERGRALGAAPPQERAHAREELLERKGLGEVVVGASSRPATLSATPSRAVSMRTGVLILCAAERLQHVEAVALGQHHVEHDEVVGLIALHEVEGDRAVGGDLDRVPLLLEPLAEKARHLALVFDDQDPHDSAAG